MANPNPPAESPQPYATPPAAAGEQAPITATEVNMGDQTGGVIPYKNPKALTAYYLGIFSFIPLLGFPLGIASIWLGCLGLGAFKRNPIVKGKIHAWIGIVLGFLFMLIIHLPLAIIIVGGILATASER